CDLGAYQAQGVANSPPVVPTLAVDSITGVSAKLHGSAYHDPEGDAHLASQWQVFLAHGPFEHPIADSGRTLEDLVLWKAKNLPPETDLVAPVRYQDSAGNWSHWSDTADPRAALTAL